MRDKLNRILAVSGKEFYHIIHDTRSLIIIFILPVIQVILFGYALNMELQDVDMAVIDFSRSSASQNLIEKFTGNGFFQVFYFDGLPAQINDLFMERKARAVLIINHDFEGKFVREIDTPVQVIIDASDPNAAAYIQNYVNNIISDFNTQYGGGIPLPFNIEPRIWYNPDLKSVYFFVPGLIAMILIMISALLTSITITREKETGTMEQILVSPINPLEIIIGKVLPYIVMAFMDGTIILLLGVLLFQVPFTGSYILLIVLSTLYITTALSLGLMISTIVTTQQVAMMLAMIITLLPTVMLSGFIFPIKSMPEILQYITYLVPAKYYLMIIRGIMLKGNTLEQLLPQAFFLLAMTAVLLAVALRKFRTNLEN